MDLSLKVGFTHNQWSPFYNLLLITRAVTVTYLSKIDIYTKNTVPFLTRWFTLPETNSQSTWKQKWCWKTILSFFEKASWQIAIAVYSRF